MPSPIGRPAAAIVPTVADAPSAQPAAPSTPSAPAENTGWVAQPAQPPPAQPARPSRLDATVDKAKAKVVSLTMNEVASEHSLGQGMSFGVVQGNVKLSEKLALKDTDVFKNLVANDRRRNDYAKANGDATWVQTRALAGVSASFPLGAGASVGFNGSVEVTSVMAHQVDSGRDVVTALKSQGKSMVLPVEAEGLQSLNAAPGTEWLVRGQAGSNIGIGVGAGTTVGTDAVGVTASVGVSVGANAQAVYTKNVKVLEEGKVYVQIARQTSEGASVSLGATVGLNINAKDPVATAIGAGTVGSQIGGLVDSAGNSVEKSTRLSASASASVSATQKLMGAAVLDLNTAQGRAAYDHIIRSGPHEGAEFIKQQGLGPSYTETNRSTATGLSLQFGSTALLATSTQRGTTNGVLEEPGATTLLTEATYGRNVGGVLPRLALGEERSVSVRAGELTKGGVTQKAVALSLTVKDPQLTGAELAQTERFATAMGTPLTGLPAAKPELGKAETSLQVALTDEGIGRLRQWDTDAMKLAFASAQREIDGGDKLPPWHSEPAAFRWYRGEYSSNDTGDGGPSARDRATSSYKETYGRDLGKDIESEQAIEAIAKQVIAKRGKPVGEWGGMLEAIGKQPSGDVRAAALALKRLAGAEATGITVKVAGTTVAAKPQALAPKSLGEIVGPVLSPPG